MPYDKNKKLYNPETGEPITLEDLPIGISYPFTDEYDKMRQILSNSDYYREMHHRANIVVTMEKKIWYIKSREGLIAKLNELSGSKLTSIPKTDFIITSHFEFETYDFYLLHLPLVATDRIANTIGESLDLMGAISFTSIDIETEIVTSVRKPHTMHFYNMPNLDAMYAVLTEYMTLLNIEVVELYPSLFNEKRKILSTQTATRGGKHYIGGRAIYNVDWQLNGEFEEKIRFHPVLYKYMFLRLK